MNKKIQEKAMLPERRLLTIDQVAALTNHKKSYIYKLVHLRQIPVHKSPLGRKLTFVESEIQEWSVARTLLTVDQIKQSL
jgi:excisionase family DNA binding protein